MKNILIFGHGYATQFIDISNQYTKLFDKNKFRVTVVYLVGKPDEKIRQEHLAHEVVFLNSPRRSTRGLKLFAIKEILKLQREKQFSLVICHRYKPAYIMLWVSKLIKVPLIISVMHELNTMKSFMRRIVIKLLAGNNMSFAGVSNAVRDDIRNSLRHIPQDRIITLYNMIDTDLTEPDFLTRAAARQTLNISHETFLFGTIGRLAVNKDHHTLISAFAMIHSQCPNAKLIIIGDGQLENELKALASRLNISDKVIFTGFLPKGYRNLKAFDVYISSSIQEAFGRVLLEAMLSKLPIIATRVNGVPEVVGDVGELIEAREINSLAEKMLAYYHKNQEELTSLGNKGYSRVMNAFSLSAFNDIFWNLPMIKQQEWS